MSMGVYIKGMEMSVTCCHCPLMGYDSDIEWVDGGRETQGAYICVITHELIDNTKSEDHCPLVPIPEPHGRLGDLDELHKEAVRRSEKAGTYDSWYNCTARVISAFDIENAPTIIHASEKEKLNDNS
jgi:uncharacterized protein (DUF2237 family)